VIDIIFGDVFVVVARFRATEVVTLRWRTLSPRGPVEACAPDAKEDAGPMWEDMESPLVERAADASGGPVSSTQRAERSTETMPPGGKPSSREIWVDPAG